MKMNAAQRMLAETIGKECGLSTDKRTEVMGLLVELASLHRAVCNLECNASPAGLVLDLEGLSNSIEAGVKGLVVSLTGVAQPRFMYDPRGWTVGLVFRNSLLNQRIGEAWGIPTSDTRVAHYTQYPHLIAQATSEMLDRVRRATVAAADAQPDPTWGPSA